MTLLELTDTAVRAALRRYEDLFSRGDSEAIVDDFTDDVEVRYGSFAPFAGKKQLKEMLDRRFAAIRDYHLSKRLEFLCDPHIASSWTGSWIDVSTNARMNVFGHEVLTVRDGKICRWSASVTVWPARAPEPAGPARREAGAFAEIYSGAKNFEWPAR